MHDRQNSAPATTTYQNMFKKLATVFALALAAVNVAAAQKIVRPIDIRPYLVEDSDVRTKVLTLKVSKGGRMQRCTG